MKKYWLLFGAVILVMALASPSMAQFKSWGHMEIQTIWESKPDFNTGGATASSGVPQAPGTNLVTGIAGPERDLTWRHIAERFRFYLQYGDPKTVRAVIGFEADSTEWGEPRTSGTVTGGRMGGYTADSVQLEIKHAFLDFTIPNTPVSVRAGIQDFFYGDRLFINNDAAGAKVIVNFAPHTFTAWWARLADIGTTGTHTSQTESRGIYDVTDLYSLDWKFTQKLFDINVYAWYLNDLFTGNQNTLGGERFNNLGTVTITNHFDDHPWAIGVNGGFRPGNWTFFGHFVYVGGKREWKTGGISDSDYEAFAMEASAKYRIGPGMFVGIEGFYASGNDADNADKIKYYPVAQSSEGRSIFGNDRTVFFWMNAAQMGYYHNRDLEFSGMWYGRANFEYSPLAWLRFNLNYLYIGDTSTGHPGLTNYKISAPGVLLPKIINSPSGSRQDKDESFIGHEINLITTVTIYQGFVYNIGLYYFIPGPVFDMNNKDADSSYGINTKLVYAF